MPKLNSRSNHREHNKQKELLRVYHQNLPSFQLQTSWKLEEQHWEYWNNVSSVKLWSPQWDQQRVKSCFKWVGIHTVRKLEAVHKLPVITVLGFDFTCLSHSPNIFRECLTDILLLIGSLSVFQFKSLHHTKFFSSSLLLINSPTRSSDFNLLNSLHWRYSKQHEITLSS